MVLGLRQFGLAVGVVGGRLIPVMPEPPGPHDPDRLLIPAFLAACSSLERAWPEEGEQWNDVKAGPRDEDDQKSIYYELGRLAHHLCGSSRPTRPRSSLRSRPRRDSTLSVADCDKSKPRPAEQEGDQPDKPHS